MDENSESSKTIVLITGANSGVGYATSKLLASSPGYHVIMAGRSQEKIDGAVKELRDSGIKGTVQPLLMNVTDDEQIKAAAQQIKDQHGVVDVLINNAAVGSLDDDVRTRLWLCLNTNVIGPAVISAAFRPLLMAARKPYSIFVTSGGGSLTRAATGTTHFENEEAYRASKAALNMVAVKEHVRFKDKLKVFTYCPGFVVSNLRGPSEEQRTGQGLAGDPMVSAQGILDIINGKRDADAGGFVHNSEGKPGTYPW